MELLNSEEKLDRFIKEDASYLIGRSEEILYHLKQNIIELKTHIKTLKTDLTPNDFNNISLNSNISDDYISSNSTEINIFKLNDKQKIFRSRQSSLTEMLQVDDYKAVYHIFVSIFLLYGFAIFISDFYDSEYMLKFELITFGFSNAPHMILVWILLFCISLSILPLYSIWNRKYISSFAFIFLYILSQVSMFAIASFLVSHFRLPPPSAILILCEQIRLSFKMHSFFREMWSLNYYSNWVLESNETKIIAKESNKFEYFSLFTQYLYFLYAPTLIYRHSYPRSARVRYTFVLSRILEMIGCVLFTNMIFIHYCIPSFGIENLNIIILVNSIFSASIPGMTVFILVFFMLFHSWLNATAEVLRFADRDFYGDWWNANSVGPFQRKINTSLYEWFRTYLYLDLRYINIPSPFASFIAFTLVVGLLEYIVYFSLHIFYPLISLIAFIGLILWCFYPFELHYYNQFFNTVLWIILLLSNGALLVLYSVEYNFRNNSILMGSIDASSYIPYSLQYILNDLK